MLTYLQFVILQPYMKSENLIKIIKNPMPRQLRSNSSSKLQSPSPQPPQSTHVSPISQSPSTPLIKQQQQPQTQQYPYAKLVGTVLQTRVIKTRPFYAKLFNSQQWDLSDRTFRDQDLHTAFKYIEQSKTTVLKLDYNKYPTIIKSIKNTHFPYLTDLYLGDNTIYSIQQLCSVDMPNLINLHLNDNPITQLRSLRRCHVPNLRMLSLRDIRIVSVNFLICVVELDCQGLAAVMLNYRYVRDYIFRDQNLCERFWGWLRKTNWNYRGRRTIMN